MNLGWKSRPSGVPYGFSDCNLLNALSEHVGTPRDQCILTSSNWQRIRNSHLYSVSVAYSSKPFMTTIDVYLSVIEFICIFSPDFLTHMM